MDEPPDNHRVSWEEMHPDDEPGHDGTVDILYLVDRLEELVGIGKRVPFSGRVMVEEEQFLALVDQLRIAVPNEIKQAQRVIRERERVIAEAQDEAQKILETARKRAEYFVSEQGILNEARQKGEEILRQAEERRKRANGEIDVYALQQFTKVEEAMREGLEIIDDAVRETVATIERAKGAIGQDPLSPRGL
jgi:F0F1-type ATP synthase membrane subunit b/b'